MLVFIPKGSTYFVWEVNFIKVSKWLLEIGGLSIQVIVSRIVAVFVAGHYSSIGSDVAWESRGTTMDPRARHIFS